MAYLADTNILLRSVQPTHPMYAEAVSAVATLFSQGETVCILPQNIMEFWNVCTRPADRNGIGLTPIQADVEATRIEGMFTLLPDSPAIYPIWRNLVLTHAVLGVQVHDARLAAAMLAHGVIHILTFNDRDFARYAGITAVHPASVL